MVSRPDTNGEGQVRPLGTAPSDQFLVASEWEVRPCDVFDARNLVGKLHYGGDPKAMKSSSYIHGLYRSGEWFGAECLGVAAWCNAVNLSKRFELPAGPLMLTRLAVHPDVPTNGASFLLGRSMKMIDRQTWPVLVTYADTGQGHTGAIYKATNWTYDGMGGSVVYYRESDGHQRSSLGPGGRFVPCPPGYVERRTKKHRFIHDARRRRRRDRRVIA